MSENRCLYCNEIIPEGRQLCGNCDPFHPAHKKNKYQATKVTYNGITFDSRKEYRRYCELKLLEKAKKISDLRLQVKYVLIPSQKVKGKLAERECAYIADFVYKDTFGNEIVEDTKGMKTKEYIIKRKLMLFIHGIRIREV